MTATQIRTRPTRRPLRPRSEPRESELFAVSPMPLRRAVVLVSLGAGLVAGSPWLATRFGEDRLWSLMMGLGAAILAGALGQLTWVSMRRREGRRRRVLVLGNNWRTRPMIRRWLDAGAALVRPIGYLDEDEPDRPRNPDLQGVPRLGGLEALPSVLSEHRVGEVLVALPIQSQRDAIERALRLCRELDVPMRLPGELFAHDAEEIYSRQTSTDMELSRFRVDLDRVPARLSSRVLKRLMDVTIAGVAVVLLSPVIAVIALLVKLTSPGPVLFRQVRSGLHNRPFIAFKFRSMRPDAEAQLAELMNLNEVKPPVFKMKNDPRLTRVGRWLRRTSLDEIPQLFNVLRGEMSLVGPRPPVPAEVAQYSYAQRRRLSMKPGLTCIWQVSGRSEIPFEQWMEMDLAYIDRWSPWLDLKLLLSTVPAVLSGRGAM